MIVYGDEKGRNDHGGGEEPDTEEGVAEHCQTEIGPAEEPEVDERCLAAQLMPDKEGEEDERQGGKVRDHRIGEPIEPITLVEDARRAGKAERDEDRAFPVDPA